MEFDKTVKVASGKIHDIYLIPDPAPPADDTAGQLVPKVPRFALRRARQLQVKRLLRGLFPTSRQRVISKEVEYLEKVGKRSADKRLQLSIPACLGFVKTTETSGVLREAVL